MTLNKGSIFQLTRNSQLRTRVSMCVCVTVYILVQLLNYRMADNFNLVGC